MPPFPSSSRALVRLLSSRCRCPSSTPPRPIRPLLYQTGRYATAAPFRTHTATDLVDSQTPLRPGNPHVTTQTRWFLSCGDGEEGGSILSKTYEERRVIGYSPEQLFSVVAAVDLYEDFVPWCQKSKIVKRNSDGSFDAELQIGFKFLVESYMSHVELERTKRIKTTASESGLFDHLINIWEFNPGPVPGTCDLYFLVDFKFQSPLYRQVASMFFKEVVSRLVGSFSDRCSRIYGPAVQVLENSFGQSR